MPNLSQITASLREWIMHNVEFRWEIEHIAAINRIKKLFSCTSALKVGPKNMINRMRQF